MSSTWRRPMPAAAARSRSGTSHRTSRSISSNVSGRSVANAASSCMWRLRCVLATGAPISSNETMTFGKSADGRTLRTPERKAARRIRAAVATRSSSSTVMKARRMKVG